MPAHLRDSSDRIITRWVRGEPGELAPENRELLEEIEDQIRDEDKAREIQQRFIPAEGLDQTPSDPEIVEREPIAFDTENEGLDLGGDPARGGVDLDAVPDELDLGGGDLEGECDELELGPDLELETDDELELSSPIDAAGESPLELEGADPSLEEAPATDEIEIIAAIAGG